MRSRVPARLAVLACLALGAVAAPAAGQDPAAPSPEGGAEQDPLTTGAATPAPAVTPPSAPEAVPGEHLVTWAPGVDAGARAAALAEHGARRVDRIAALDIDVVRFDGDSAAGVRAAAADPRVAAVEANLVLHAAWTPDDPGLGEQWGLPRVGAPAAWDVTTGSSDVTVAIVDTGVQRTHPDLAGKVGAGYDFVQDDEDPDDASGHGTHIAGTVAALTNNTAGGAGVCPGCRILPVRVLDDTASGSLDDVASGIAFAADQGAQVVNVSVSGGGSRALERAVDYAVAKGSFVACAAGNGGTTDLAAGFPGAYPGCMAVAATTREDARAAFSNHGPWVELAAPGVGIFSTWTMDGYDTVSGTSFAVPFVSGVAGLLASQGLTGPQIRERLCATADPIAGTGTSWTCGRVDAARAVGVVPPSSPGLLDGGFEGDPAGWTQSSSGGYELTSSTRRHGEERAAWLGGYDGATDVVAQEVTVPAGGTLRYWWWMSTRESGDVPYDRLEVRVVSPDGVVLATPRTWSNGSPAPAWAQDTVSLAAWAGGQVRLEFRATNDDSLPTSFFVDDVELTAG